MQNQQVDRLRTDANERIAGSGHRTTAVSAQPKLARDWPSAASLRADSARAVGFSRRQFEGRSGPAGSVALALLMAPNGATSTGPRTGSRTDSRSVDRSTPLEHTRVESAPLGRRAVGDSGERFANEPLRRKGLGLDARGAELRGEVSLPRAVSTPELACTQDLDATPRWVRPLVDSALTAVAGAKSPTGAGSQGEVSELRWDARTTLPWEPIAGADCGRAVDRNERDCKRGGRELGAPLADLRNTLHTKLVKHLRSTPRTALSSARRALAKCEEAFEGAWSGFGAGSAVHGSTDRAEVLGAASGAADFAVRPCAGAPAPQPSGTASASVAELAASEWASAAVFTSLLALLFML